jgi:hypothetical protein
MRFRKRNPSNRSATLVTGAPSTQHARHGQAPANSLSQQPVDSLHTSYSRAETRTRRNVTPPPAAPRPPPGPTGTAPPARTAPPPPAIAPKPTSPNQPRQRSAAASTSRRSYAVLQRSPAGRRQTRLAALLAAPRTAMRPRRPPVTPRQVTPRPVTPRPVTPRPPPRRPAPAAWPAARTS